MPHPLRFPLTAALVLALAQAAGAQQQAANTDIPTIQAPAATASVKEDLANATPTLANADLLMARGRYLAAIRMYGQLQPTTAYIQNHMGVASERMLMFDQAQKCFEEAIRLDPAMSEVWNNLGTVFHSRGDLSKAEKMYRKAIKLRASSADSYQNLGALFYSKGKYKKGDAMYKEAIRIDPGVMERTAQRGIQAGGNKQNMAEMHFHLACTFAQNGNSKLALDYLRRSIVEGFHDRNRLLREASFADLRTSEPFLKMVDDLKSN